jgi:short-subunit dehydrogenase
MSTSGQTAVVTGASSGLGAEFARLLAQDGHDVVLVARRRDRLDDLASRLQTDHGIQAHVIAQDLTAPQGAEALVRELEARNLHADYLINNAGAGTTGAFATADLATELAMLTLNITALVHLTRLLLPGMLERDRGRILTVGSVAGFMPGPFMADYYASKAFVNSFSQALSYELRGSGVTATLLSPGPTSTEFAGVAGVEKSRLFALGTMTAERVAKDGYRGMQRGRARVVPGFRNRLTVFSLRTSPTAVVVAIAAKLNRPS